MSQDFTTFNYEKIAVRVTKFISEQVKSRKKNGVIIGLSGGLDSSVCLMLAAKALDRSKIIALIMPERGFTPQEDIDNAYELTRKLKIKYKEIHFEAAKKTLLRNLPTDKLSGGNLSARMRMALLFHYSGKGNLLVLGTSDKSEIMIGYFTKFGDGASDILPLGGLYKTQVRILATKIGVSEQITMQPSSPRFWKGHEAEKEIGLTYNEIDLILQYYLAGELDKCNLSKRKIKMVTDLVRKSSHKREQIPICDPF
ncbi:MAG TPA: NAD+ synthase [Nitrososphaeraceae archaeon]|nr:NAD+ synthase [Nitrososphaeraceae archaeon]